MWNVNCPHCPQYQLVLHLFYLNYVECKFGWRLSNQAAQTGFI